MKLMTFTHFTNVSHGWFQAGRGVGMGEGLA
jgi:hypothetical protein